MFGVFYKCNLVLIASSGGFVRPFQSKNCYLERVICVTANLKMLRISSRVIIWNVNFSIHFLLIIPSFSTTTSGKCWWSINIPSSHSYLLFLSFQCEQNRWYVVDKRRPTEFRMDKVFGSSEIKPVITGITAIWPCEYSFRNEFRPPSVDNFGYFIIIHQKRGFSTDLYNNGNGILLEYIIPK